MVQSSAEMLLRGLGRAAAGSRLLAQGKNPTFVRGPASCWMENSRFWVPQLAKHKHPYKAHHPLYPASWWHM